MIQMRRLLSINYLLSSCIMLLWSNSRADDQNKNLDMTVSDRFLQEAPGWWDKYERRLRFLQGIHRFQNLLKGSDITVELNGSTEWKANERSNLCIENSQLKVNGTLKNSPHKALCINSRYGFILQRRADESSWILSNVVHDNLAEFNKKNFNEKGYPEVNATLITFERVRLKDIVKRKEFQITACRTITVDNEPLVEVSFNFDNKGIEETFDFQGGKIVLDPQRFWCLRSYEAHMNHPSFRGTRLFNVLERGETEGLFPWAKHFVIDSHFNDGRKKTEDFKCDLQIPVTLPSEDEFTLTAFGLPEPTWMVKKPMPWYLWVGLAGIISLALASLFRWKARRATGPTENPQP